MFELELPPIQTATQHQHPAPCHTRFPRRRVKYNYMAGRELRQCYRVTGGIPGRWGAISYSVEEPGLCIKVYESTLRLCGDHDAQPVISRVDMRGQLRLELCIIEIGVHVGEDGALRPDARDPLQRLVDAQMGRVRLVAQRVHDPDIEAGKGGNARRWQVDQVAGVGDRTEAITEGRDVAMV